ncbi:hypothetical protein ABB37_04742 [Leptomonas pyrrhocoris]|uniref:Uncharacterized protein n=1 Tax=Leptomonas pyrrhocoris TaxID=157538 RepID=A0A0N0VFH0_LEPPY|nr:hypothetical protein ABB37_04742 [Leptomonas pyrrhocoris]KPA80532.1 hypothetical protein ABB37_04742 [Leptomonas pyrrhocoris]|eukprot:XP_015658971.1 hypothetical protein ABB37_04742 [Leptomonas pyrrhocoris]
MMPADPVAGPSTAGRLQWRTSLLEAVRRYNEENLATTADLRDGAAAEDVTAASSLLKVLVQRTPNVTNPSWAMEECGRLCPNVELWCGSALAKDVWAPPGTPDCPFGTQPADFRIHH